MDGWQKQQVSRTHAGDDKGGGYGVLMISDSMGAAEIIAIEKVREHATLLL